MMGDVGECDRETVSGEVMFATTSSSITNVQGNGECFDIDLSFNGFAQEGRGQIVNGGEEVHLELFFMGQAQGHRCADGNVGSGDITLNGMDFMGDAVQVYVVNEAS